MLATSSAPPPSHHSAAAAMFAASLSHIFEKLSLIKAMVTLHAILSANRRHPRTYFSASSRRLPVQNPRSSPRAGAFADPPLRSRRRSPAPVLARLRFREKINPEQLEPD